MRARLIGLGVGGGVVTRRKPVRSRSQHTQFYLLTIETDLLNRSHDRKNHTVNNYRNREMCDIARF